MKQQTFVYFIGTAGSGKSTLTNNFKEWMRLRGLDAITVNLDPGAENLPYEPDVDICDWISLKEIMDSYGLGPNGAQIACADMLALNTSDVKKSIESFKSDYIIVDTPGQLELFVFREAGKYTVKFLNPEKSIICVTTGTLRKLKPDELEGVIGHEMSHIKNHDILIATVTIAVVGTIALISEILFYSLFWGGAGRGRRNEGNAILLVIAII